MDRRTQQPARPYRMSRGLRIGNAVVAALVRIRAVPQTYLLTTVGRRTGLRRTVPVTIVEQEGRRWLVAPYGPVSWVHNARAAGHVTLRRGRQRGEYTIREAPPAEAGPVLKAYVGIARVTRPYFDAAPDSPPDAFAAEAGRHPVFELLPAGSAARPTLPPRWFIRLAWQVHRALVTLTGGRRGLWTPKPGGWGAMRVTTVGRRSARERAVILGYLEDGPDLVTLAMNGWGEGEPAWWLNLQANPRARVDLATGSRDVVARAATGPERDRLWAC